jgi:hypothetical protein
MINTTIREKFFELAEEHNHYYGHRLGGCVEGDKISSLLNSSSTQKPEVGFGSIHITSINGAMHAEPNDYSDRLILLITPLGF